MRRARAEYERDVRLAWATEYMARQKTLDTKAVTRLLTPTRRPQTPAELNTVMQQLSAQLGIPLRRIPWPRAASS